MRIPRITELYFLFKIYFLQQIHSNGLAGSVYIELQKTKINRSRLGNSFFGQIADVSGFLGEDCLSVPCTMVCEAIRARFSCWEENLVDRIRDAFGAWDGRADMRALLLPLLRVEFGGDGDLDSGGVLDDVTYAALQEFLLEVGT